MLGVFQILAMALATFSSGVTQLFPAARFSAASVPLAPDPSFEGGLLGVSARVTLREKEQHALVRLSGVPVGGVLEGVAVFGKGREVILEAHMERALRRRLCSVVSVEPSPDLQSVDVALRLPVFGKRTLRMRRVEE